MGLLPPSDILPALSPAPAELPRSAIAVKAAGRRELEPHT